MLYYHNLNPIAFYLDTTPIPWYWLNYLLGYFIVYFGAIILTRRHISPLPYQDIPIYALGCWCAVFSCGRLGYVLIYRLDHYLAHPEQIHQIWLGGMSFHGALIGCAVTCFSIAYLKKQSWFLATDLFCLFIPMPLALGRVTNFINGELLGRPTASGLWGVIYPHDPSSLARHPSALYQATLEGGLLFVVLWCRRTQLSQPGKLTSMFLMGYGGLRIISEFYRLPDPQIGYIIGPFTLGHLLCTLMVVGGVGLYLKCQSSRST